MLNKKMTKTKITPTIAKIIAEKVYTSLKNLKIEEKDLNKKTEKLEQDPNYNSWIEFNKEITRLTKLKNKLEKNLESKHKCSLNYYDYRKDKISLNFNATKRIPSLENIKNDILLMTWNQHENLNSDQLIESLIKKYK